MIHGFNGSPADFSGHGAPSLASVLSALPGVAATYFNYQTYASDWVTDPHIGPALAADIACLGDTSRSNGGSGKVILVAHSMGGLAVRYAAAQRIGGRSVATRIGLVVTVATPNTGSWIDGMVTSTARSVEGHLPTKGAASNVAANQILALARRACGSGSPNSGAAAEVASFCGLVLSPDSPAGRALVPGSRQLAALPRLPDSLPLFAVAGDIELTTGPLAFGPVTLPLSVALPLDVGDLLVTPASALAGANHPGALSGHYTDACSEPLADLDERGSAVPSCSHTALLDAPPVTAAVTKVVRRYLVGAT
jgi:triacylglycerol lipase